MFKNKDYNFKNPNVARYMYDAKSLMRVCGENCIVGLVPFSNWRHARVIVWLQELVLIYSSVLRACTSKNQHQFLDTIGNFMLTRKKILVVLN